MIKAPINMTPGDDTHLTLLMAPVSLNFVTGQDREHLLAYGRAAFEAGQKCQGCAVQQGTHVPMGTIVHPDDMAVDALAAAMKAKLAKQRAKGYGGWDTPECTQQHLSNLLRSHVEKGDVVDVSNFCAFLLARGEAITAEGMPLPLLVRDIANELNVTALQACEALKPWGNYSINSAVTADMAKKLREKFPVQLAAVQQGVQPFGYVNTYTGQFFADVEPCRKNNEGHWRTVYTHPTQQGLDAQGCDMFWVADDPDGQHETLHDAVVRAFEDGGIDADRCVEIQCAKSIPNIVVRITGTEPFAFEMIPDSALATQAKQGEQA